MKAQPQPPAVITALAWFFGLGAGVTLLSTPLLIGLGWLVGVLLVRLRSQGLGVPTWYPGLLIGLFVILLLVHLVSGVVSLKAARDFLHLRPWAWRWFDGLVVLSLVALGLVLAAGLVMVYILLPALNRAVAAQLPFAAQLVLRGGFSAAIGVAVACLGGGPLIALAWLLRSRHVRPLFSDLDGGASG